MRVGGLAIADRVLTHRKRPVQLSITHKSNKAQRVSAEIGLSFLLR